MAALAAATRRMDIGAIFLPVGILAVVAMMVLPLPVALLDIFFVFNILLSLLILMVAMHAYRPLDFSSFPTLLLIATVLRLALNVASTRIVLSEGHTGSAAAGKVIEAFGAFVIAGNFAVGLVVFLILVIINLVVITKGAGRVSEVSARFTLDAMPGKQMAIDADLNAGIISPEEARARRAEIAEEADFYGAMDGASKFVKGDAVAGILILLANIIGGIIIGTSQFGLSLADASETYVLLSIGDGLVAQIPSLLLSIATAIIVTRVASDHDMAGHIGAQIGLTRALLPVAAVMAIIGFVPGMPNMLFLVGAALAGGAAFVLRGRDADAQAAGTPSPRALPMPAEKAKPETEEGVISPEEIADFHPITIQIGFGLIPLIDPDAGGSLISRITAVRRDVSRAMGFVIPAVRVRDDLSLPSNSYRIRIGQAVVAEDQVYPDRKLALPAGSSVRKMDGIAVKDPSFGMDAVWIAAHQQAEAEADDHVVVEPDSVISTHLSQILSAHAGNLIGPDDVQTLLDQLERHSPTLVQSVVPKLVPLHILTSVLRHLLSERLPIGDLPRILEGLAELSGKSLDPIDQAEALRPKLAAQLIQQIVPFSEAVPVIVMAGDLEELLLRASPKGQPLIVEPQLAERLLAEISKATEAAAGQGRQAIVVVSAPLRRPFAQFLRGSGVDCLVFAVSELPERRRIEIIANLGNAARPALGGDGS